MNCLIVFLIFLGVSVPCFSAVITQTWVVGWGDNTVGQSGLPYVAKYAANGPTNVSGGFYSNVTAVSAGGSHSLALAFDGTVLGWGDNESGAAAGFKTQYPYTPTGKVKIADKILTDVVALSSGDGFSLALKRNGNLVSWGEGRDGGSNIQISAPPSLGDIVAIAAGGNCGLAVRSNGTVLGWGSRKPSTGLSNIVAVVVGRGRSSPCLALTRNGRVIEWVDEVERRDLARVLMIPAEATNVVMVAAGAGHSLALRGDGTVVGWGRNRSGQATGIPTLGFPNDASGLVFLNGIVLSNIVSISAGGDFSLALRRDGRVVAWGDNSSHQTEVPHDLSNVIAIAAGDNFCLAITTNSAVAEKYQH